MSSNADVMAQAWQFQQAGDLIKAEALYRQILASDPRDATALYRLAVVCQRQSRSAEAHSLYRQLLQIRPDAAAVHNNLGLLCANEKRLAEAIGYYHEAVRLDPNFAEAFNNLGLAHATRREWDQAQAALSQAVTVKPAYVTGWTNLGWVHVMQNRLDEAVRCYRQALAVEPTNAVALNNLGTALLHQGKPEEAATSYRQAVQANPHYAAAVCSLAEVLTTLEQWDEAYAGLEQSLAINPNEPTIHAALGDLCFRQGKQSEALRCFQRALALRPSDVKGRLVVEALSGAPPARLPAEYLAAEYDPLAEGFDHRWRGDYSPGYLQAALEPPPPTPSLAILDLGCGTGLCGKLFRSWAQTLVGVDISSNMLAMARARGIYDELLQSDLVAVKLYESTFDLILASDVMLYLGDLAPLFIAVQRALRPGGRFAFTLDLHDSAEDYRLTPVVHFTHSRGYLKELTAKSGLREVSIKEVYWARENGFHGVGVAVVLQKSEPEA